MTPFELQQAVGQDKWPTVLAYIEPLEARIAALEASLAEHQRLSAEAARFAAVEIEVLRLAGANVAPLVAILTDVSTPIKERERAAKQAEVDAAAALLAAKQAELEALGA